MAQETVRGYLAEDPRLIETKDGKQLAGFRMGETQRVFDQEAGQWKDGRTDWYSVTVGREELRDNVLNSLQKGQRVSVTGNYSPEAYVNKENQPRINHRIWADDVSASLMHNSLERQPSAKPSASAETQVDRGPEQQASPQQVQMGADGLPAQPPAFARAQSEGPGL